MNKIKCLDPVTVSKIAAGEVIDRPVSIIKELVENSLDAGATDIRIHVEDGGKQSIKISDNGSGISKSDLHLAVTQHATSKINALEDIYTTLSFGFRGEALSSIAHVSQLDLISNDGAGAYAIRAHEREISAPEPTSHPQGTTINVNDLFFDIPVRRKFLKSKATELSHITDLIMQFALIHPTINFQLISEDHEIINTTGIDNAEVLLIQFYGSSIRGNLIPIHHSSGAFTFNGLITSPVITFTNKSKQIVAVNQRLIKSGVIQKAVSTSYKDLIPGNRHPVLLLHITANQQDIDINIHPQKHEIKFLNPGHIFQSMPRAIQHALYDHQSRQIDGDPQESVPDYYTNQPFKSVNASINIPDHAIQTTFSPPNQPETATITIPETSQIPEFTDIVPERRPTSNTPITFIQVYDTYIALKGPEGQLWVLDQHAVHERILYEKFKVQFEHSEIAHQTLLVPVIIELSKSDYPHLESIIGHLNLLGFTSEPYGPQEIAIREIPNVMASCRIPDLVQQLIQSIKTVTTPICDLTHEMKSELQMKACKAAIKAGKHMSAPEVQALLQDLLQCPSNFTCPHGRPLVISFDKKKLETLFNRS